MRFVLGYTTLFACFLNCESHGSISVMEDNVIIIWLSLHEGEFIGVKQSTTWLGGGKIKEEKPQNSQINPKVVLHWKSFTKVAYLLGLKPFYALLFFQKQVFKKCLKRAITLRGQPWCPPYKSNYKSIKNFNPANGKVND